MSFTDGKSVDAVTDGKSVDAVAHVTGAGVPPQGPSHSHKRVAGIAIAIAAAIGLLVAGFTLGSWFENPANRAALASPPPAKPITTTITTSERFLEVVTPAAMGSGQQTKVLPPIGLPANTVVTEVFTKVGDPVKEGQLLADLSGQPLIAVAAPFPFYRDLAIGDTGPDVTELSRVLNRLGYLAREYPKTRAVDGAFKTGVTKLLKKHGYRPIPAPRVSEPKPDEPKPETPTSTAGALVAKSAWFAAIPAGAKQVVSVALTHGAVVSDATKAMFEMGSDSGQVSAWLDATSAQLLAKGSVGTLAPRDGSTPGFEVTVLNVATERSENPANQSRGFRVDLSFTSVSASPASQDLVVSFRVPVAKAGTPMIPQTAIFTNPAGDSLVKIVKEDGAITETAITVGVCAEGWCVFTDESGQVTSDTQLLVAQ